MGSWGDVIYGAEVRTDKNGVAKAQYATVMLRDDPHGDGLECTLTVFGDTDAEAFEFDLVTIRMDTTGLRRLAESALDAVRQMEGGE